jgi:cell division protein FtsQ
MVGPEGTASQVLAMYHGLKPMLDKLDLGIAEVVLTGRGGWSLHLDTGATVELGRGTSEEVLARSQRFALTLAQVTGKYGRRPEALVTADLRHTDGYAVKLRGVATTDVAGQRN